MTYIIKNMKEYRRQRSKAGKMNGQKNGARFGAHMKKLWQDPEYARVQRMKIKEAANRPEVRAARSERASKVLNPILIPKHTKMVRDRVIQLRKFGNEILFADLKGFSRPDIIWVNGSVAVCEDAKLNKGFFLEKRIRLDTLKRVGKR